MSPEPERAAMREYGYFAAPRMCSLCRHVQTATEVLSGGPGTVYYCTLPELAARKVVYERGCCDRFERNMAPVRPPDSKASPGKRRPARSKEEKPEPGVIVPTVDELIKEQRDFF